MLKGDKNEETQDTQPASCHSVRFGWHASSSIAGLLYLLRFERVDNLGAYSIPSKAGLLIPSGYNNYG